MKKKNLFGCMSVLAVFTMLTACGKEDKPEDKNENKAEYVWGEDGGVKSCDHLLFTNGKENLSGKEIGLPDEDLVFTGKQILAKGVYTMNNWIYVADGAVLTIEAGTIVKGNAKASIIVERGGKLIAKGTKNAPIVFTSAQPKGKRKPGDWGGIILCGKARNNQEEMMIEGGPRSKHGGNDDSDNSGVLSYVRLEFCGTPFQKDQEINGLTMGSVGSGTQIDHVQVSYSNDDSFEWFGGKVNAKFLVAYHGWDDDFDTDNGYSGNVQFGLVIRNSKIADTSQSNGFESDNNAGGSAVEPYTKAIFSNITFVGPKLDPNFVNDKTYINAGALFPNNGSALGKFQAAMHIRRYSKLNCYNSLAVGYPIGLILDKEKGDTQGAATVGELKLENIWFAGMDIIGSDANKLYNDHLVTGFGADKKPIVDGTKPSFSSTYFKSKTGNKVLASWNDIVEANGYTPKAGSEMLTAAAFPSLLPSFFNKVKYIGAFSANDNWLEGWTEFDPQNANY